VVVVCAWALAAAPARAAVCAQADAPAVDDAAVRAALVCLVNNERVARGLAPVAEVGSLDRAAQRHVDDMAERDYLGHLAPEPAPYGVTPGERAEAAGYVGEVGEVVHFVASRNGTSARLAMASWMASATHCGPLLGREIRHVGVGVVHGQGVGTVTDIVQVVLGTPGTKLTMPTGCTSDALVAEDAVPPAAAAPAAPVQERASPLAGVRLGSTGVARSSGTIRLKRGASAAPLALQCGRTSGRCRGTATLWVRGRILGRMPVTITTGIPKRLSVPIAYKHRKRLLRRSTRATLRLSIAGVYATRKIVLRG
jgi:uncharacterized protein YkwD